MMLDNTSNHSKCSTLNVDVPNKQSVSKAGNYRTRICFGSANPQKIAPRSIISYLSVEGVGCKSTKEGISNFRTRREPLKTATKLGIKLKITMLSERMVVQDRPNSKRHAEHTTSLLGLYILCCVM